MNSQGKRCGAGMAKKKTVPEELRMLWDALNETREYVGLEPLSGTPLSLAECDNGRPLSLADGLQNVPVAAVPKIVTGGKGGTAVQQPLTPLLDVTTTAEGHGVNGPSTAVTPVTPKSEPDYWAPIAKMLRMYCGHVAATRKGATLEERNDIWVRYVVKHGKELLLRPGDRQRLWIIGAALFCERNPSAIKNPCLYMEAAIASARDGGSPCQDEYFRAAEELYLSLDGGRPVVKGSIAEILKGIKPS